MIETKKVVIYINLWVENEKMKKKNKKSDRPGAMCAMVRAGRTANKNVPLSCALFAFL